MPSPAHSASPWGKPLGFISWLVVLLVFVLSGASIWVVFQDLLANSRMNAGMTAETYRFLYGSTFLGLLGIIYQLSQRHFRRMAATILGLLPVLGLTLLIGITEGWEPKYGWSFAAKQVAHSNLSSVYTYVEQMPALPTGGGLATLCDTLSCRAQRQLVRTGQSATGTVRVSWVVNSQGMASRPEIEQNLTPMADSAVVAAVRSLPPLQPGKQNGQAVAVRLAAIVRLPPPPRP